MKFKFFECPDFRCSRSDGTLEPVTSSFSAASESLRGAINSQSNAVAEPVKPLSRSFPQLEFRAEKPVVTVVRRISVAATGIPKDKPERRNTSTSLVVAYARCKSLQWRVKLSSPKYVSKQNLM